MGFHIPAWLAIDYRSAHQAAEVAAQAAGSVDASLALPYEAWTSHPTILGIPVIFNALAVVIVMLITWLLIIGVRESARVNNVMVVIKLLILGFFVYAGLEYVRPENWTPFMPQGFAGVSAAAATVFFAYIGFDAITTTAEESRNPQRDLPIGIMAALGICTLLYVAVAAVLTGLVPSDRIDIHAPVAEALRLVGYPWGAAVVAIGAVAGITSVLVVLMLGQIRVFFAISRDGLLSPWRVRCWSICWRLSTSCQSSEASASRWRWCLGSAR